MNKRKLRMVYRRYLFSYSFEALNPPIATKESTCKEKRFYLCKMP